MMSRKIKKRWIVAALWGLWLAVVGWGRMKPLFPDHPLGRLGLGRSQVEARLEREATRYLLAQAR
jgi:hypothetical protein